MRFFAAFFRSALFIGTLSLLFVRGLSLSAQSAAPAPTAFLERLFTRDTLRLSSLERLADSLHQAHFKAGSWEACAHKRRWETLRAYLAQEQGRPFSFGDSCPPLAQRWYYYVKGVQAFRQGSYRSARASFEQSLALSPRDRWGGQIWLNIGSCHQMAGRLDSAIRAYDSAYAYLPPGPILWLLQINIAGLNADRQQYQNSLYHAGQVAQKAPPESYYARLARYNLLSAYTKLDSTAPADTLFRALYFEDLPPGSEWSAIRILLAYCHSRDDTARFQDLSDQYRAYLEDTTGYPQLGTEGLLARLYLHRRPLDFELLWDALAQRRRSERQAYTATRYEANLQEEVAAKTRALKNLQSTTSQIALVFSVLLGLVVLFWLGRLLIQGKRFARLDRELSADDHLQTIKAGLQKGGSGRRALQALLRLDKQLRRQEQQRLVGLPLEKLNPREKQTVYLLARGMSAQEILMTMDISPKYLYNLKSSIKKKLQIPSELKLEDYLQDLLPAPGPSQKTTPLQPRPRQQ